MNRGAAQEDRADRPRLILAANAVPGRGGQGLNFQHMAEGLKDSFSIEAWGRDRISRSKSADLMGRLPGVRRFRDWQSYLDDRHFDLSVAARLVSAQVFQGAVGQCARSLSVAKALGCRTCLDVVTEYVEDFVEAQTTECRRFGSRPATHPWMKARILREYERADRIRVMSERARQTFLRRGFAPERLFVARPPVDLTQFSEAPLSDDGSFRVCYVGLVEPWKGFHYLVEAFRRLNLPRGELVLWGGAGSRPVTRYLKEARAQDPHLVVRPEEVRRVGYAEVYGKAHVLVQPSITDGFGYVVLEAMASGLPVIVTRRTGAADLVDEGYNGFIVPEADSDAIAERLEHLARHPSLLRKMGKAARETARRCTLESFRGQLVPSLRELLS